MAAKYEEAAYLNDNIAPPIKLCQISYGYANKTL